MYLAMQFVPIAHSDKVSVQTARTKPFKSLDAAIRAVKKTGNDGYVKQQGQLRPVWNNLQVN